MKKRLVVFLSISVLVPAANLIAAEQQNEGKMLYQTYCTGCHGTSGKGDGPAAKTLPVKPADHTRSAMNKHTDQFLTEIVASGGAGVGKSAQMPAWGGVLKERQIHAIVNYIRSLSAGQQ